KVSTVKLGSGFVIKLLPTDVSLPALKSLFLDSVRFHGFDGRCCSFKTLLSQSPALEELVMDGMEWERWRWCSTVSSKTLQRLTLQRREWFSYDETDEENIRVDSWCLTHEFDVPKEYLILNLDSIVEVNLNLCADEEGIWRPRHANTFNPMPLINTFKNVEILCLAFQTLEMFDVFNESIQMF
ncbi:unnamed protein product, partial [Eruca vesicaria subsp. sativa]|nr:unnamed protein product [Eruca vesicaria subsp. sativa]